MTLRENCLSIYIDDLLASQSRSSIAKLSNAGLSSFVKRAGAWRSPGRIYYSIALLLFLLAHASSAQTITVSPNLGTYPIGEIQLPLTAIGGNGTYSWSIASGSLPPGLSLRTDVPASFPANTGAGIIGVATTPGTYTFTVAVTSGGSPVSQVCTMKIIGLTLKDSGLPEAFVGVSYNYTFTALGAAGSVAYANPSSLPPGMSLSSGGTLSGSPTSPGFYNISFSMNDGTNTIFRGIGLRVWSVQITTPGLLPNATRGNNYTATLVGAGGTPGYTFSVSNLPSGLSLNPASGVISGTVLGGQGRFGFSATVTDQNNASYTKNMTIDILHPTVTAGFLQPYGNFDDCTIGISCSRGISLSNGGTAPFAYAVSGLPPGMDFRTGSGTTAANITPGDLELWGTPTASGLYNIAVTATDANSVTTIETFPLTVSVLFVDGSDRLPNGTRGTAYSKTQRVLGGTGPYSVVQLANSLLPSGISVSGFLVSGTPVENGFFNGEFQFSDSGSHTLHFTEYFNVFPLAPNVNINNGPNLGTIVVNTTYTNQLSACCVASYTWAYTGGTMPPGLSLSSGGLLVGTPTTPGFYTFTVQATDQSNATNFGIRVFTVYITPLNYSSCCTLPFGNVGTAYSQTLSLTGATGAPTFTLASGNHLPPGLNLNSSTGLINGTPTQPGQFQFTINAIDSGTNPLIRTFTLYVFAAGQTPPLSITNSPNLGTWTIGEVQLQLSASGGTGTYSWGRVSGSLPPGLAIRTDVPSNFAVGSSGLIGIASAPGVYNFTLSVTSGTSTVQQAFTMKITGFTVKDPYNVPNGFINMPYSYTLTPLGNAGPVTWTATSSLPPGLTLSPGGVISGTPTQAGNWNVNYRFTDGVDTDFRSFGIAVYAVHFTTSGLLPNARQNSAYNAGVVATGGTGSFSYAITSGGLPNGLSFTTGGSISGTPNTGPGRYGFTVTATDTGSNSYSQVFSIDVIGVPPSLPSLDPVNVNVIVKDATIGFSYTRIVSVFNGGTAPFTWTATGLPPGMSIRPWDLSARSVTPDDAEIWGTPTASGTFNVTLTVTDANGSSASVSFPFTVSLLGVDGNDQLPNGTVNTPYSKQLRVLGGTGPYTVSQFNPLNEPLPALLSLNPGTFTVSGTPLENGSFTAVMQFQDSAGNVLQLPNFFTISGGASSTITINQTLNLGTTILQAPYSFQLSACCAPSGSVRWSLYPSTQLPPGITLSTTGLLSGTPTVAGTYLFGVQATDSLNSANSGARALQIIVTLLSFTSGFNFTLPYGNVGNAYSDNLLASLTGANGQVTVSLVPGSLIPPGLTLSNGILNGIPTAAGRYGFTLVFTDAANNTLIRTFTLFIYPPGNSPALQLITVPPCRVIDTRNPNGPLGGPFLAGGVVRSIPIPSSSCGIPANAVAYSLNITVVPRAGALGYLSVWPTGQTQPLVSTLNSLDGSVLANAAVVPAGIHGAISAFATNDTELIIDINGYFVPPTAGSLQFYALPPCRILDTRNVTGTFGGPFISGGTSRTFPIPSGPCGAPSSAAAYSLNVTVVPHGPLGYLTAWPAGQTRPLVSTLNSLDGTVLANAAIVPAGTGGGVSFFAANDTDLILDINGYFGTPSAAGLNFYTVNPCRLVDTRNPTGPLGGPTMGAGTSRSFSLPLAPCGLPALAGTAQAYMLNMTVVPHGLLGYLTTWPDGAAQPLVSTLNALKGQIVANMAIVPASFTNGAIDVFVTNPTDVIVDTSGYFGQ
jgi:hypothetical protein